MYNTIACIGSTNWTVTSDYTEKNCMFVGDGAAALIMQPISNDKGILSIHTLTSGDSGIGEIRRSGPIKTQEVAKKALAKAGHTEKDIDFLITHNPTPILVSA